MLSEINSKRDEMIKVGMNYGFTDEKTIKCSQEIDQLIFKYQQASQQSSFEDVKMVVQKILFRLSRAAF
ncbi:aspartyl-phosphate phosphatase Spo0E family protein [Bacillus sp. C11]|nr:aspartyl-phosphate phosphatase Spo0E family protein [Neobacillus terrae]